MRLYQAKLCIIDNKLISVLSKLRASPVDSEMKQSPIDLSEAGHECVKCGQGVETGPNKRNPS